MLAQTQGTPGLRLARHRATSGQTVGVLNMTLLNHWGRATPVIENGRLVRVDPMPDDPDPSRISDNLTDTVTGPMRIAQPMVRKGYLQGQGGALRGEDSFVPVSWDEATRLVADHLQRIITQSGNEAIFAGSYGWASAGRFHQPQVHLHRFLNLNGGFVRSVNTHSHAAAEVALPHITGSLDGLTAGHTPWDLIAGHATLFVAFGGLPLRNAQVAHGGVSGHRVRDRLAEAKAAGTRFVSISPLRDDMDPGLRADWIAPRPNSDVALMLGLAHVLDTEGLADRDFLDRYTVGYDRFRAYLLGQTDGCPKSPDWAAAITGVDAAVIRDLARDMAGNRTMISMAFALQRADHGEQPVWMTVTLAAMLGQIGLPGGGFGFGYCGDNQAGTVALPFSWPVMNRLRNPVRAFIPVARLADMLEHPRTPFDYGGARHTYPDIRMIWWAGGNPFHHQQDLNRLRRVWKNPELVVVQEPFWNANARHADIVLPCTLPIERNDLGMIRGVPHLVAMRQHLPPFGDARSDYDILTMLADSMGTKAAFTEGRTEADWIEHLYAAARTTAAAQGHSLPDFRAFWAAGEARIAAQTGPKPLLADFRNDPAAHPLKTPSGKIEIHSATVAAFGHDDCPGLPTWLAPAEWTGNAPDGALHLISNQPAHRLHSQLDHGRQSRAGKIAGREPARLHPTEAQRRGIVTGDLIVLTSARGACLAGAVVSDAVAPGCVQMATGAWADLTPEGLDRHGNVNVLTLDKPTSRLAQGPVAQTALVRVEKVAGPPPPMRAFDPPEIWPPENRPPENRPTETSPPG